MLVVSHDRYFLDRICDQIVAFEDGGLFVQPGNYSYYLEKKIERDARLKSAAGTLARPMVRAPEKPAAKPANRPRKLSFKEQRELDGMEAAIHEVETRAQELEAMLNDPAFYATRSAETPKVIADLEAAKAETARLYHRWEELDAIAKQSQAGRAD